MAATLNRSSLAASAVNTSRGIVARDSLAGNTSGENEGAPDKSRIRCLQWSLRAVKATVNDCGARL